VGLRQVEGGADGCAIRIGRIDELKHASGVPLTPREVVNPKVESAGLIRLMSGMPYGSNRVASW
jgi:hypothetical protein